MTPIQPVLLCDGSGTRLWPLSRALYPKQVLQFQSEEALIVQAARRTQGVDFAAPLVICNEEHRFLISALLHQASIDMAGIVLEREERNTGPAAAIAALYASNRAGAGEDPLLLLLPSDHVIPDAEAFRDCIRQGVVAAESGRIVTFGIEATRAETGYGYIEMAGGAKPGAGAVAVQRFVEKPDAETDIFDLKENESTFIAPKQAHRLASLGPGGLKLIEVQCGDNLHEDDIMRLEDNYGRQ